MDYCPVRGDEGERRVAYDFSDFGPSAVVVQTEETLTNIEHALESARARLSDKQHAACMLLFKDVNTPPQAKKIHWVDGGKFNCEHENKSIEQQLDEHTDLDFERRHLESEIDLNIRAPAGLYASGLERKEGREEIAKERYKKLRSKDFVVVLSPTGGDFKIGQVKVINVADQTVLVRWYTTKAKSKYTGKYVEDNPENDTIVDSASILSRFQHLSPKGCRIVRTDQDLIKSRIKDRNRDIPGSNISSSLADDYADGSVDILREQRISRGVMNGQDDSDNEVVEEEAFEEQVSQLRRRGATCPNDQKQ